jgi:hypothetical protein
MRVRNMPSDEMQKASSLNLGVCEDCSALHLFLFDRSGQAFATAILELDQAEEFLGRAREYLDEIRRRAGGLQ